MNRRERIVVATGNPGKLIELDALLRDANFATVAQTELGVTEAVEDGLSFIENALIKARNAARHTGLPAIADDSGIVVDALNGRPGIYSARYAGENASDAENNEKLLAQLQEVASAKRSARFICAAVYVATADDPCPLIGQGVWPGEILTSPRGNNGFGYDPLFLVDGDTRTSAELPKDEKNKLSHRAQAIRQLAEALTQKSVVMR